MFAHVAFNKPLDATYTYSVPDQLIGEVSPGALVEASFANQPAIGCVVSFSDRIPPELDSDRILPITRRVSPGYEVEPEIIQLARFVSDYYFASFGECIATASVVGFQDVRLHEPEVLRLASDWRASIALRGVKLTRAQLKACETLEAAGFPAARRSQLSKEAGCGTALLAKLEAQGLLVRETAPAAIHPPPGFASVLHPTADQQRALDAILPCVEPASFRVFLLHGVTGSGKTEVYLQAIEAALKQGRTALCLLPEISLTPQTVERFETRFRQEIGVFHSQQTRPQKLRLHEAIRSGRIRIVIGARSAVFAPLSNLGIILLDEEHDGSYKQNETPRYHARDVAIVRAQRLGIPVVLGSATPSLESWHNASTGKYELLRLSTRAAGHAMPAVRVIDLADEAGRQASPSLFSRALLDSIQTRLDAGEQTLLFLNRRGFSNFLFCPSCKWVAKCDEDDVALTVHHTHPGTAQADLFSYQERPDSFVLRCHFCGARQPAPRKCPGCEGESLMSVGAGTQRVEEELSRHFPKARLLRLDQDTAGGREKFLHAWNRMISGDADIIFGTQMIAKGLHLERITLVGVILADVGLFLPDVRAEERTFQLLTQVAGRSGRVSPGDVLLQTYLPGHTAIRFATTHDTEGFFAEELQRRRKLGFPPFKRLIALTISDADRAKAYDAARQMAWLLGRLRRGPDSRAITVNGPSVAPIARLSGRFRFRILMRAGNHRQLSRLLRAAMDHAEWKPASSTRLTIDVDPLDLL